MWGYAELHSDGNQKTRLLRRFSVANDRIYTKWTVWVSWMERYMGKETYWASSLGLVTMFLLISRPVSYGDSLYALCVVGVYSVCDTYTYIYYANEYIEFICMYQG